jgi:hypothetical protein
MADNSKPVIELNIPVQVDEKKQESSAAAEVPKDPNMIEEMPTITTLLQRKKLGVAKAAPAPSKPAAAPPAAAPAPEPEPVAVSTAPEISLDPIVAVKPDAAPAAAASVATEAPIAVAAPISVEPAAPISIEPAVVVAVPAAENAAGTSEDMAPVIAPAARRARGASAGAVTPGLGTPGLGTPVQRRKGEPPVFRGTLMLEKLELKAFQKMLGKHKKNANLKKLDCLGYFACRFAEIAYFEVTQPGSLQGVLGFGNPRLVGDIRSAAATPQLLPSLFEVLAQGEIFVGAVESLREEDRAGLLSLGFSVADIVGAFPMTQKKAVTGLWLCTAPSMGEIPPKEIAAIKKTFTGLVF